MKPNQKSLLSSLALGTALILTATSGAQAAVIITIAPSGANVVASGRGNINTTALSFPGPIQPPPFVNGSTAELVIGTGTFGATGYYGAVGPSTFGIGTFIPASWGAGNNFGVVLLADGPYIIVPVSYHSTSLLRGTATWNGATISSLGLTPGTYVYNWGSGLSADSLTVEIVPEPSHALLLLGGLGTLALRRRR